MKRKTWALVLAVGVGLSVILVGGFLLWMTRERPDWNTDRDGLALSGYDPVTYFPIGGAKPRLGSKQIFAHFAGRRYHFVNEENRERFRVAPQQYEPQFGGWCAYAVANGYKFEVDPEAFMVVDDRLLLFYRGLFGDTMEVFEREGAEAGLRRADDQWARIQRRDG